MYNQIMLLVPVLLPTLVIKAACNNTNSDVVFLPNMGHAEANNLNEQRIIVDNSITTTVVEKSNVVEKNNVVELIVPSTARPTTAHPTTEIKFPEDTEGVVFVPYEAPVMRLEDTYDSGGVKLRDVLARRTADDLMNGYVRIETAPVMRLEDTYDSGGVKLRDVLARRTADDLMNGYVRIETESPPNEIVFIPGSNNDHPEKNQKDRDSNDNISGRRRMKQTGSRRIQKKEDNLDCSNLDCNNNMKTICGGKIVHRKLQYRLFLNDCYFRKVNCNLKYEINRYKIVPSEKCVKFGLNGERPFSFTRRSFEGFPKRTEDLNPRRSFSSRRSMSMNMDGQFCSHPCPVSCPEDYEPECAISSTGQHRVFMNHCKLDDNSCLFAIVWHSRPLSECVGTQKADMRQNRFFIGWMQQVGIIDGKGKLVLE